MEHTHQTWQKRKNKKRENRHDSIALRRHTPVCAVGAFSYPLTRRLDWTSSRINTESCGVWFEKQDEASTKEVNRDETRWKNKATWAKIARIKAWVKVSLEKHGSVGGCYECILPFLNGLTEFFFLKQEKWLIFPFLYWQMRYLNCCCLWELLMSILG